MNFSYSWAPIGWGMHRFTANRELSRLTFPVSVIPSEIFPLNLRSTGISVTTSTTWMSNLYVFPKREYPCIADRRRYSIIGLVSPKMLAQIPSGGTYFFFAAFSIMAFLTACTSRKLTSVHPTDHCFARRAVLSGNQGKGKC